jgi:hypothetical protein
MKPHWDTARDIDMEKHFKDIVKNMKEETVLKGVEN